MHEILRVGSLYIWFNVQSWTKCFQDFIVTMCLSRFPRKERCQNKIQFISYLFPSAGSGEKLNKSRIRIKKGSSRRFWPLNQNKRNRSIICFKSSMWQPDQLLDSIWTTIWGKAAQKVNWNTFLYMYLWSTFLVRGLFLLRTQLFPVAMILF